MTEIRNPLTPSLSLGGEGKGEGRSFGIGNLEFIWNLEFVILDLKPVQPDF
jgi:hypothetical protein